jgi:hypothetical protein
MSRKVRDSKNRFRSKTVAFRISPEEAEKLRIFAYTSGLTKQDYLIKRVLQQDIIVTPNPRVQKALRVNLNQIALELHRINQINNDSDVIDVLKYILEIIDRMGGDV